ncbi:MAG TPA: hypothetical protein VFH51_13360, partial [Myxococcota bacterium]|nr:hypothetical protein [Myxococcota bacterium]
MNGPTTTPPARGASQALAEHLEERGAAELRKPQRALGRTPLHHALRFFARARRADPNRANTIGDFLDSQAEHRHAIRCYRDLYEHMPPGPQRARVAYNLGDAYLQLSHESRT